MRRPAEFSNFSKGLKKSCRFVWSENVVMVGTQSRAYKYETILDLYAWSSHNVLLNMCLWKGEFSGLINVSAF